MEQKLAISGRLWGYIRRRNQDVPWLDRGGCKKFPLRAAPWKKVKFIKQTMLDLNGFWHG
nr:unknown [Picea sitchensis]